MLPLLKALAAWHPWPGCFIAILALLGVLVPLLRDRIGKREKAVWTAVMFGLLILEVRSLKLASDDFEKDRVAQNEQFSRIAESLRTEISTSQNQFSETMGAFGRTLRATSQTVNNTRPRAILEFGQLQGVISPLRVNN